MISNLDTYSSRGQPQPAGADHRPQEGGAAGSDQFPDQHTVPRVPPHARRHNRLSRLVNLNNIQCVNM